MNTKLTMNLEQDIIEQAKEYAKSKNKSVFKLVEEYLCSLVSAKSQKKETYCLTANYKRASWYGKIKKS